MKRAVIWTREAEQDLLALPDWQLAQKLVREVDAFAATGVGHLVKLPTPSGFVHRLMFPPTRYYARVLYADGTIFVERVIQGP